ncbi:MAG: hypothetical protein KAH32_05945 [Chlamydiia bacterium]|nr:hypothetical protein [Chlamydiia bacterium]
MSRMKERVITHAPKGARLMLISANTYRDLRTGYIYALTLNEMFKYIRINGSKFKEVYTTYISALPLYIGIRHINEGTDYSLSAYEGFKGHSTDMDTVYESGLRDNAKPSCESIEVTLRYTLSDTERASLGI